MKMRGFKNLERHSAFTYIELLIALAIIAVLFVPIMQLFSHSLYSVSHSQSLITATNLAKWGMERTKNLNVTKAQLKEIGDEVYPPAEQEPIEMNHAKWRIKRDVMENTDPLEVRVSVYRKDKLTKPIVTLVTLIEDMTWEEIRHIK